MKKSKRFAALLLMCCAVGFSSCDKEETTPQTETEVDLGNARFYFIADMNGKTLILPEGKDGYESHALAYEPMRVSGCVDRQAMRLAKGAELKKSLEVSFIKRAENCITDCSQVQDMYKVGTYTFGKLQTVPAEVVVDGVVIRYTDVNGKIWSTDFGTGNQAGSSFRITEHTNNTSDSRSQKVTTAEVNCKLYDGSGEEILLTNGKIVSRSVQCGAL